MKALPLDQTILIVEDSDDDFEATERALKRNGNLRNPIYRCETGEEALDFLFRRGDYADPDCAPRPSLVLLDLNLPGKDGRAVLSAMKSCDDLRDIPVVVLTTSDDERDVDHCYRIGANSYTKKPVDMDSLFESIKRLKEYWFEISLLPGRHKDTR